MKISNGKKMSIDTEQKLIYKREGIAFLNRLWEHFYSKMDAQRLCRERFKVDRNIMSRWTRESYYNPKNQPQ